MFMIFFFHVGVCFVLYLQEDLRPTMPATCPEELKALICMCWDKSKDRRLTSNQLADALEKLNEHYLANKSKWDELVVKK